MLMRPQSATKTRRLTAEWKPVTTPGSNKRSDDHVAYFEILSNGLSKQNSARRRAISSAPARRAISSAPARRPPPRRVHRKISSARGAQTPDEDSPILENFLNQRNKGWGERTKKSRSKQKKYMYRLARMSPSAWSEDEDNKLRNGIATLKSSSHLIPWQRISKGFLAGKRSPEQCKQRWQSFTEHQRSETRKSSSKLRLKQKATSERLSSWKSQRKTMTQKKAKKDREKAEKRAAQAKAATERRMASFKASPRHAGSESAETSNGKDDGATNRKSAGSPYAHWYSYKTERAKEVQKQKTREEERVARKLAKVRALTNMTKGAPPHPQSEVDLAALRQAKALLLKRLGQYHSAAQFFEDFGASPETKFSRGNVREMLVKMRFKPGYLIWLAELIFYKAETEEPGNVSFQDFLSALERYMIPTTVLIPSATEDGTDKGPSGPDSSKAPRSDSKKSDAHAKRDGHHAHNYRQYFQQEATSHALAFYKTERMMILEEMKRKEEEERRRSALMDSRPKFQIILGRNTSWGYIEALKPYVRSFMDQTHR